VSSYCFQRPTGSAGAIMRHEASSRPACSISCGRALTLTRPSFAPWRAANISPTAGRSGGASWEHGCALGNCHRQYDRSASGAPASGSRPVGGHHHIGGRDHCRRHLDRLVLGPDPSLHARLGFGTARRLLGGPFSSLRLVQRTAAKPWAMIQTLRKKLPARRALVIRRPYRLEHSLGRRTFVSVTVMRSRRTSGAPESF
jgi:hypothetical protein